MFQSIRFTSWRSSKPVAVKAIAGSNATTAGGSPCHRSVIQSTTVIVKVAITNQPRAFSGRSMAAMRSPFVRGGKSRESKAHVKTSSASMRGTATSIHSRKPMEYPDFCRKPMATALGGEAMGVPIPPRFAAKGTESVSILRKGSPCGICASIGATRVIIMAVLAVLLIHMEKSAVTSMSPRTSRSGRLPKGLRRSEDMALSTPSFTAARARRKPPKNSSSTGSAATLRMSR